MDHKPGRDLDALIAEKVMGYKRSYLGYGTPANPRLEMWDGKLLLHYSTDIAAAWEVVEKLDLLGVRLVSGHESYGEVGFSLGRRSDNGVWVLGDNRSLAIDIEGTTAPHAICLAALKAVDG